MNILKQDNTITFKKFKCLNTNQIYEIVQTECTGRYIINAIDTIVRSDGLRKSFARMELKTRFTLEYEYWEEVEQEIKKL